MAPPGKLNLKKNRSPRQHAARHDQTQKADQRLTARESPLRVQRLQLRSFLTLMLEIGVDRIMFSADHPYASTSTARSFLDRLPASPADKEKTAHLNAESLLQI